MVGKCARSQIGDGLHRIFHDHQGIDGIDAGAHRGMVHQIKQPEDFLGKAVAMIFDRNLYPGRFGGRDRGLQLGSEVFHLHLYLWMEAAAGQRARALQIHADFDDIGAQGFGCCNSFIKIMLDSDSHAAHIHRKVVFEVEPALLSSGFYFPQVGRIKRFQNPVIQMKPVKTHKNSLVEEFECAHLPGPGQFEVGPGLPDAVQIETVGVQPQQHILFLTCLILGVSIE